MILILDWMRLLLWKPTRWISRGKCNRKHLQICQKLVGTQFIMALLTPMMLAVSWHLGHINVSLFSWTVLLRAGIARSRKWWNHQHLVPNCAIVDAIGPTGWTLVPAEDVWHPSEWSLRADKQDALEGVRYWGVAWDWSSLEDKGHPLWWFQLPGGIGSRNCLIGVTAWLVSRWWLVRWCRGEFLFSSVSFHFFLLRLVANC